MCYIVAEVSSMKTPLVCLLLLTGCTTAVTEPSSTPTPTAETTNVQEEFALHFPEESIVALAEGDEESSFEVAILSQMPTGYSNHLHVMDEDGTFQSVSIGDKAHYSSEDGFTVKGNTIIFTLYFEDEEGVWGPVKTEIEAVLDGRNIHWKNVQEIRQ